jgi:hypothetical protein
LLSPSGVKAADPHHSSGSNLTWASVRECHQSGVCHSPRVSGLSRAEFESLWDRLDAEALASKQSQDATVRLTSFYGELDEPDRAVVDEALADWVVGGDDRRVFDALVLIRQFEIRSALPALERRAESLAGATEGPPKHEREKIERIVRELG